MAEMKKLFLCVLAVMVMRFSLCEARLAHDESLAERVESEGMARCWESLLALKSCTGEVILFFLNGETYLGPSCCKAIRVIEHNCWAAEAMLAALGFTPEEGDALRGFCDASSPAPSTSSSSPAPSPA
ncbi:putative Egg cell-secreted protein 1.1/1.5 [Dioscorea sansibarensis]